MGRDSSKKKTPNLGKSLIRSRFNGRKNADSSSFLRENCIIQVNQCTTTLKSVTEETSIATFINETKLAGARFEAEREENFTLVNSDNRLGVLTPSKEHEIRFRNESLKKILNIPRRPQWDKSVTHEQQITNENMAFLSWRRKMAELEDKTGLVMTPFERNIEVWKQLWRVVEKSDLLLQIVDCRNPLLFMCADLEEYAQEVDLKKSCITIMNKSDLLSEEQRAVWSQYFKNNNIDYVFYSALSILKGAEVNSAEVKVDTPSLEANEDTEIYTNTMLLDLINEKASALGIRDRKAVVGLVGYPNVGKSSTINSLVGKKCQSVSSTPGKTKHFQTIHLSDSLIICDCPGLVFPSLATTKAELICNGILPIDQIRDYMSPSALIVQRIPLKILENVYNIKLPVLEDIPLNESMLEVTTRNFLKTYALSRGFTKSTQSNPDESKSARYILKDYVNAKIIWCQPPPEYDEIEFNKNSKSTPGNDTLGDAHAIRGSNKKPHTKPNEHDDQKNINKLSLNERSNVEYTQAYVISRSMSNEPYISFEDAKKMHKTTKHRQLKQRVLLTRDSFL